MVRRLSASEVKAIRDFEASDRAIVSSPVGNRPD